MHAPFVPLVRRLLDVSDVSLTFLDIGSRNGVLELEDLAPYVLAFGFEPNADEYRKLVSGETDAAQLGVRPPAFRKLTHLPYAVADVCGQRELYITRGPGAVSLREPNIERLREIKWKGRRRAPNFGDEVFPVLRVDPVEVKTIEWVALEYGLTHIDYLKLDVESSEYEVLAGAGPVLDATSLIKVEVCFIPFRKGQKLFSHVDLLLRDHGFDLLRYEIVPMQVGYKEREGASTIGPSIGFPDRYGQPLMGDAVYVNRGIKERSRLVALAALLIEQGYLDEALFLLRNKVPDADPQLLDLLQNYQGDRRTRLFEALIRGYRKVQKLAHPVRSLRRWLGWRRLASKGVVRSAP